MNPTPVSSSTTRRTQLMPLVGLGLAVILTLLSGVLHGRLTQRWQGPAVFEQPARQLQSLPAQFGDWELQETLSLSESAIELLQCQGYLHHVYRNHQTGQRVQVAVMVGPGSKMSIHVPEICFEAANYSLVSTRERVELRQEGHTDAFWFVRFRLNDVSQQPLFVLYGWSKGDEWLAPRMPRWSVAGTPVLYKLQLSTVGLPGEQEAGAAGLAFLADFVPLLRKQLAVNSTPPATVVDAASPNELGVAPEAAGPPFSSRSQDAQETNHHSAVADAAILGLFHP